MSACKSVQMFNTFLRCASCPSKCCNCDWPMPFIILLSKFNFDFSIPDTSKAFSEAEKNVRKGILSSEFHSEKIANKTNLPIIPFNDFETSWILSSNINPLYPRSFLTLSAYKALAIATYCGYDKVYICGFDNTYIRDLGCDENNKLYRIINHFYLNKSKVNDPNYFRDYKMGVGPNEKSVNRCFCGVTCLQQVV